MTTASEAAYAAGFFDGEGCAMIAARPEKRKNYPPGHRTFTARLTVTQCDIRPLQWLQERFGGKIRPKGKGKYGKRPVFVWEIASFQVDRFVPIIRPYVIVKGDQLDLLMAYRKYVLSCGNARSIGLSQSQIDIRADFHRRMHLLNAKSSS